jgi:branched-chain amino acid transport system substrate-binding protein
MARWTAILRLLSCCIISFISLDLSAESAVSTVARRDHHFRVGAILPLSGPLADYGAAVRNGFELAQREQPEAFKDVQIIYQDSSYDGRSALNAFNALFARGDIDLYYVWGVTPSETLLPVLASRELPVVSETTLKSSVVGKPLAVRAAPTGDMAAWVLGAELLRRGYRSIGMLLVDIPYYRDIVQSLEGYLRQGGATLEIVSTLSTDANDFKTTIARSKAKHYDAMGIFLLSDQVVTYYRQAAALRAAAPTFGAAIHDSQELINRAGPAVEGALLVAYDVDPMFRKNWVKLFKDDTRVGSAAQAYDTALIIGELFCAGKGSKLTPKEIVAQFATISYRRGVSGELRYSETSDAGKHFDFPLSLRIIKNGRIEVLPRM